MNLSRKVLSVKDINCLKLGLKFIPKPELAKDYKESFAKFRRNILLKYYFHSKQSKAQLPFTHPSTWSPPIAYFPTDLLGLLDTLEKDINSISTRNVSCKLSQQVIETITRIKKSDPPTIFKAADKGSSLVLMDLEDYIAEAKRQLGNKVHYRKIDQFTSPDIREEICSILQDLKKRKFLRERQVKYLEPPEKPRKRYFYLLPKIHKEVSKWNIINGHRFPPGRPIVSDVESDTYRLAEYIDHFLQKVGHRHPSYLKDTPDFISKLKNLKVPTQAYLITLDVDALYTNIDNKAGLEAIQRLFDKYPDPKRPDKEIPRLLELSLQYSDFEFFHEFFLQIWGTAMGKKWAPPYADAFLAVWEEEILKLVPLKPSIYLRFLDDIFMVWEHSLEDFDKFLKILNSHRETVKLKATIHETSVDFLDVTIFKGPRFAKDNILDTKVFFKPTDTHELLHKLSYHPRHTYSGILKSQFLRFYRISNNKEDFHQACKTLCKVLVRRQYSKKLLRDTFTSTMRQLVPAQKSTNHACTNKKCTLCQNHLMVKTHICDTRFNHYDFDKTLTCQSDNIVYAITCSYCDLYYIGQTANSLVTRFNAHKSAIRTNKDTQLNKHFQVLFHPTRNHIDFLRVIPLERVTPHRDKNTNMLQLIEAESRWIKKLDTTRVGLNGKNRTTQPIPFVSQFSDHAVQVRDLVKDTYSKIQQAYPNTFKGPLLMSYSRNKNCKEYAMSTKDPSHPRTNKSTIGPLWDQARRPTRAKTRKNQKKPRKTTFRGF